MENSPELYLGLYVDDFVFFSTCLEVKKEFERRLKKLNKVDFMGKVSHFLGIKFQWTEYRDSKNTQQLNSLSTGISNEIYLIFVYDHFTTRTYHTRTSLH